MGVNIIRQISVKKYRVSILIALTLICSIFIYNRGNQNPPAKMENSPAASGTFNNGGKETPKISVDNGPSKHQGQVVLRPERVSLLEGEIMMNFKKAFKESELQRAKVMFNKVDDSGSTVGFLIRKPSSEEVQNLLNSLKKKMETLPSSEARVMEEEANEYLRVKVDRFERYGDEMGVLLEIPSDATRVPYVTTWKPDGDKDFHTLVSGERPMLKNATRVVYDEEAYSEILKTEIVSDDAQ